LVFVIAPTAGRNLAVFSSFIVNGLRQTLKSSEKLGAYNGRRLLSDMRVKAPEVCPVFIEIRIGSLDEAPSTIGRRNARTGPSDGNLAKFHRTRRAG
jgi:hypothetical protein